MKNLRWIIPVAAISSATAWQPSREAPALPLDSFVCPPGLEVTVWAVTPQLHNPTNLDVDHRGRVWVTEGVNYRSKANRQPQGDKIIVLEDSNADGRADKSTVFWQDPELVTPLGIAVFDNVIIVSQPPHLLKLTDTNRDLKFNPADGDTREVLLTGFNGRNHDHSLHSLTGGPDGKWYFNQGNCGAVFTDQSGREFPIGSAYFKNGGGEWPVQTDKIVGDKSADGFSYVGGFTVRMNPDATDAEIIGHGYRNSYEQTVTSHGHVFQNDNDDPPACRTSHILEHGNAGFFSRDGKRFWKADVRPGQETAVAEWRQEDPGTMPAGDVYGGGSPTGIAYYENGALGDSFAGTLLSCEPGRNVIFSYQPQADGAGFELKRNDFLTTNPEQNFDGADFTGGTKKFAKANRKTAAEFLFRPSDICVGPDGALYVTDWTDPRVGGHSTLDDAATGVIYRIAPKGFKPVVPSIIAGTPTEGAITALRSPAVNVRWLGFQSLKSIGENAYDAVAAVLADPNPSIAARAIWLMPYLGGKGLAKLEALLTDKNPLVRLTAFRAIRRSDGLIDDLPYARKLATDASPALRAEAASAMRYRRFTEARQVLVDVAVRYDGKDRSYLELLGIGAGHHHSELWDALVTAMKPGNPAEWTDTFARLTWRLMPQNAIPALKSRAADTTLTTDQRKLAVDSLAFINTLESATALMDLAADGSDVRAQAAWWLNNRLEGEWSHLNYGAELETRGLVERQSELAQILTPPRPETTSFQVADVLALTGDPVRGKAAAARCVMCHKIDKNGFDHGPELKGFGSRQAPEVIAKALIQPSLEIAAGYEGTRVRLKDGKTIDGIVIADGNPLVIRSTAGVIQKIPRKKIAAREPMSQSLMLNADQLGLSAGDVADIISWMKSY